MPLRCVKFGFCNRYAISGHGICRHTAGIVCGVPGIQGWFGMTKCTVDVCKACRYVKRKTFVLFVKRDVKKAELCPFVSEKAPFELQYAAFWSAICRVLHPEMAHITPVTVWVKSLKRHVFHRKEACLRVKKRMFVAQCCRM